MKPLFFHPLLMLATGLALLAGFGCSGSSTSTPSGAASNGETITLEVDEAAHRVDVFVDGDLFTAYYYPGGALKKPVLYPIHTASGTAITRGYPLDKVAGERVDHPHHIGFWLNYGDVNGLDFWNHSESTPEDRRARMGTIEHTAIREVIDGNPATLAVTAEWKAPDGEVLLREDTQFEFRAQGDARMIDRITTLTALDEAVDFTDNKEGMIAIRVRRALEHPEDRPVRLTGPDGMPMDEPVETNEGVTGMYTNAEGVTGTDVWGKRAPWAMLSGTVEGEPVTVAILDHPDNVGYPTYWHARGYGLFAANPLGQKVFSEGAEELNFRLENGESTTFRHRVVVLSGEEVSPGAMQAYYDAFAAE